MVKQFVAWCRAFAADDSGASAVEYGLIVGLIAVALIAVLALVAGDGSTTGLTGLFSTVADEVNSAGQ